MIRYYKRSLINLFGLVQKLRVNPYERSKTCLQIQESLLKHVCYIEQKIRECRAREQHLNKELHFRRTHRLVKTEAQKIKNLINSLVKKHDEYQHLLVIFRSIGDALAFTYIDKWDIKPQSFKQAPGFLSQKAGLKRELKIFRGVFSLGHIGILNDLTNCLRYGDISVPKEGKQYIFEVKSGKSSNSRIQRQLAKARKLTNYITNDETDSLYGINGEWQRVSLHSPEVHHRRLLNSLIKDALENQNIYAEVEDGLYYILLSRFKPEILQLVSTKCKGKPIFSMANDYKYNFSGYYPFALSIYDSEAWYNFCYDKLIILVVVDSATIEKKFNTQGLSVELLSNEDWAMDITNLKRTQDELEYLKVSRHLLGRVFAEFLSLDWLLQDIIHHMKSSDGNIK